METKIIEVLDKPFKTNSSNGKYATNCFVEVTYSNGIKRTMNSYVFHWSKKDADYFYNHYSSKLIK